MATRTIANGGGNWSTAATWVEGAVPSVSDALSARTTSGNLVVDALTCICASMVIPQYVNNIKLASPNKLTVAGSITLAGSMSGTGGEFIWGNSTTTGAISCDRYAFPGKFTFAGTGNKTLNTNLTATGVIQYYAASTLLGSFNVYALSGIAIDANQAGVLSTWILRAGSWTSAGGSSIAAKIRLEGNINIPGDVKVGGGGITWVSGNITIPYSSTLTINAAMTLNTPATNMSWANIASVPPITVTLTEPISCGGDISMSAPLTLATSGLTANGINVGTAALTAPELVLRNGTWQGGGNINAPVVLAGDATISGAVTLGSTYSLTYRSGNITTTGSTLELGAITTLNTNGFYLNDITSTANSTTTLSSNLDVHGNFTSPYRMTFTGVRNISAGKGFTGVGSIAGTEPTLILNGSGTIDTTYGFGINTIVNTAGTITITDDWKWFGSPTLTYVRGAFAGNQQLALSGCTLTYNNVSAPMSKLYSVASPSTIKINSSTPYFTSIVVPTNMQLFLSANNATISCSSLQVNPGASLYSNATSPTLSVGINMYINGTYGNFATLSANPSPLNLIYNGDINNSKISLANIVGVGANAPLFNWFGTTTGSTKIYDVGNKDIGGAITITHT